MRNVYILSHIFSFIPRKNKCDMIFWNFLYVNATLKTYMHASNSLNLKCLSGGIAIEI